MKQPLHRTHQYARDVAKDVSEGEMSTTEPWLLVTPEQFKAGWIELRGVTQVHHAFIRLKKQDDGNFVVRNPRLEILERGEN